ncbi:regulatory protein TetR [Hyphomonas adhaerens MHS-3]|uniref:Regulatory protein TetR n=1 Tax=Hyphomonas adhaerens MHS-3 TaxID=1280949 RepID=A0A069E725_9PROT|nr:TetR/AcrR family transcriptional regulator [Hyphomonas adhaerens]KCZ86090.1 regulatory protein TetR [Hyphomonas adhaerens MHS-3]
MNSHTIMERAEIGRRKRRKTRAILVDAAMRVFAEKGLEAATNAEVFSEAGVSRGTFYNYFETKEDLLKAVASELVDQLNDQIDSYTEEISGTPERLAWTFGSFLNRTKADPVWARVILSIAAMNFPHPVGASTGANIARDMQAGRDQGLFTLEDDEVAINIMVGTVTQAMHSTLAGRTGPDHAYHVAKSILLALGTPEARATEAAKLARQADL